VTFIEMIAPLQCNAAHALEGPGNNLSFVTDHRSLREAGDIAERDTDCVVERVCEWAQA
jgi:hypothetical protein